ncbi:MAG: M20/M25/M40 family metallo-hydrolase [Chloroflexia bacterium]|nr:M20/M25/M40 family metallo-hydrolase [Chloroflexia bacterium]
MTDDDSPKERALRAIDREGTVDLLRRAVATPSVTGGEGAIAGLLRDELEEIGLDAVELFDFVPGRPNVWGRWGGGDGGDGGEDHRLLFAGHTDTVEPFDWAERWRGTDREDPFAGVIAEDALWGRGAADMKAGVVASVAALKAIRRAGLRPKGEVLVAFVGDEESGVPGTGRSAGMKAIVGRIAAGEIPRPDFVVYAEPTTLDIYTAQIGFLIAEITVVGESAYFGLPWLGVDALKGAHRLLARLFAYSDELWARADHPLLGRAFALVTAIEGGGPIAVPETCRLSLIRKILPGETVEAARSEIEGIVGLFAMNEGVRAETAFPAGRDSRSGGRPSEVPAATPGVAHLERAVRAETGKRGVIKGAPFWAEASFFVHDLGIPAVYCGPGDIAECHTARERVEIEELIDAVRVYVSLIVDECGVE